MSWQAWATFCTIELVLCLTPGPAVFYVASTAMSRGPRAGFAGACGIVAGNTLYFVLSALGVAAVILASNRVFTMLKWLGAAYLLYMGISMLLRGDGGDSTIRRPAAARAFMRGFAVQAANPKALAFFVALLPQFIDPRGSVAMQVSILGLSSQLIEIGVLSLYIWLAGRSRALAGGRAGAIVKRVAGGLLVAAGARLAF